MSVNPGVQSGVVLLNKVKRVPSPRSLSENDTLIGSAQRRVVAARSPTISDSESERTGPGGLTTIDNDGHECLYLCLGRHEVWDVRGALRGFPKGKCNHVDEVSRPATQGSPVSEVKSQNVPDRGPPHHTGSWEQTQFLLKGTGTAPRPQGGSALVSPVGRGPW